MILETNKLVGDVRSESGLVWTAPSNFRVGQSPEIIMFIKHYLITVIMNTLLGSLKNFP